MKITILKPSRGRVTTTWLSPAEVVELIRSERYSQEVGEFRGLYPVFQGEQVQLPQVNNALPAICFGAELERGPGNNFLNKKDYHPQVRTENGLLLLEISNLKDYKEAIRLRDMSTQLPQTFMAFVGYDDRSVKMVVKATPSPSKGKATPNPSERRGTLGAFRMAQKFYSAQLGVTVDVVEPSVTQLCSVSYDPNIFYHETAVPFYAPAEERVVTPIVRTQREKEELLPGRDLMQSQRMAYQFCLEKALDKHFMATDEEEATKVLCQLAVYCRESGLPLAFAIHQTSYRPDLSKDMQLVSHVFTSTYQKLKKRKANLLKHVNPNSLLMWSTQAFMDTYYDMRLNVLTHQPEFRHKDIPGDPFRVLEKEDQNTMTIRALEAGLKSWDRDLERYINSREIEQYNPVEDYLDKLPRWDGEDRVTALANRIPTDTPHWTEFFHIWMLGMVACWMGRDREHGNALVPLLTGYQGSGKTSFCRVLLPTELRGYYAENLNLKNDTTIALAMSSRALINIDEFDKYTRSQHPLLKFLISQSDVDMRLPFAAHIEQRRRFASFIATTNSSHPLVDSTGSRRYVCVHVTGPIDFLSPIDYPQLYAQLVEELQSGMPFWLNENQTAQLMRQNDQFQEIDGLEQMVMAVFKRPEKVEEGQAMTMPEIVEVVQKRFPGFKIGQNTFREVGRILAKIGIDIKHTREGNVRFVSLK